MRRSVLTLALLSLPLAAVPAAASAAGTIRLASASYSVREGDGAATIAIVRSTSVGHGEIRYAVWHRTADYGLDYTPVKGRLDFVDGQTQVSFHVPIVDDPYVEGPETVAVGIWGAYPQQLGQPSRATLTILDNDTIATTRDALNPLALNPPPPGSNPLEGARFYTNPSTDLAGTVIKQIRHRRPVTARLLETIADEPEAKRFGAFNDRPGAAVAQYLARAHAEQPDAVPLIATYRLQHHHCGGVSDSPGEAARYKRWYAKLAQGIGNHPVVAFLEIDALITAKCLSPTGRAVRVGELRSAIASLAALPHAVAYVDAGAADARLPAAMAKLLRRIGVFRIQGFFTNATHQDWTSREIGYGRAIARLLGGVPHFVVNTAANGRGPLIPHSRVRFGNSFRCNAPGRGLGPKPTSELPSRYGPSLDGLFWIGNPGRSAGVCSKTPNAPPAGHFWVEYAVSLVRHADFRIR